MKRSTSEGEGSLGKGSAAQTGRALGAAASLLPQLVWVGTSRHRLTSLWRLGKVSVLVTARRHIGRRRISGWDWAFETVNAFLREQRRAAFRQSEMRQARAMLESVQRGMPDATRVEERPSMSGHPAGVWLVPERVVAGRVMLYLQGGGYVFRAANARKGAAWVADAAQARTFFLDYRLAPEHPFPAQLEDAVAAYRFLLSEGCSPDQLIVAGDEAGGHLMITLLVELKRLGLPAPALGIGLSPWLDLNGRGPSLQANRRYDWVQSDHLHRLSEWVHHESGIFPLETSAFALELGDLPPLYLQVGGREILVDMIREFAFIAELEGAAIEVEVWDLMTHDFQFYGTLLPESREALERIGEVADRHLSCRGERSQSVA